MSDNDVLEGQRAAFAREAMDYALTCTCNRELITWLEEHDCQMIGEGSTRRVYASPLGVVVKVQRESPCIDPLTDAEMKERGGNSYNLQLGWRRRWANLLEIRFAAAHPLWVPRQYGYLGSFGVVQRHPSILVSETARPLHLYLPNDGKGIHIDDIGIDPDGYVWIFDRRLTTARKPSNFLPYPYAPTTTGADETIVWLGNMGVTTSGHYTFIDRSDHGDALALISEWTLCPKEWGWTWSGTAAQTREFSNKLSHAYERQIDHCGEREENKWEKEIDR